MEHTEKTLDIYLKIYDFPLDKKIKYLYNVETEIKNRPDANPLKEGLNSEEKYLLDYIQAKRTALKRELEENEIASNKAKLAEEKKESKGKPTKTERVTKFADSFVLDLLAGEYATNKEVIDALKEIESEYNPIGEKQKKLLKGDGRPYEKRICIALADIFEIREEESESINWTTIRDHYKDRDMKIK